MENSESQELNELCTIDTEDVSEKLHVIDLLQRVEQLENLVNHQQKEIEEMKETINKLRNTKNVNDNVNKPAGNYYHSYTKLPSPLRRQQQGKSTTSLASQSKFIYRSSGSLRSDSPSRESMSPRASPLSSNRSNQSMTKTNMVKKWNSSVAIDSTASVSNNKYINKSAINLSFQQSKSNTNIHSYSYNLINDDEKYLEVNFRGQTITLPVPKGIEETTLKSLEEPKPKLSIDWVYGYRGKDCRKNLFFLPTAELLFFTGRIAVLLNINFSLQRHYLEHTDEIKSMALHPNKLLIATGQGGSVMKSSMPHIRIWNSITLNTNSVIGISYFSGPITSLSFSNNDKGSLLVSIEDVSDKTISVWDWQSSESGKIITEAKCSVDPIVTVEFNPLDKSQIVTAGKSLLFWSFDSSGFYKRIGCFDVRDKPKYITCVSFTQCGDIITGDTNGNIAIFNRHNLNIIRLLKKVHEGPVFTIYGLRNGSFVSGGGKDGKIILFQENLSSVDSVYLIEPHFGGVRTIIQGSDDQIYVGTVRNCILGGNLENELTPLIMGHVSEINALAVTKKLGQFITGGSDNLLQLWDSLNHTVIWSKDLGEPITCCEFSPTDEKICLVGVERGRWLVFNIETRELQCEVCDGTDTATVIKFSPNGQYIAVGSKDGNIYIYEFLKNRKVSRVGKCNNKSNGSIIAIDWSSDNQFLRSNSNNFELLFWSPYLCRQLTGMNAIADTKWDTQNCILTCETIGIWPETSDDYDILCTAKNQSSTFLAVGSSNGTIQLFNYPVSNFFSQPDSYEGHNYDVCRIAFNQDGLIVSVGRKDHTVIQWRTS